MDVLEELTEFEDQIDRAHIERRIDDWLQAHREPLQRRQVVASVGLVGEICGPSHIARRLDGTIRRPRTALPVLCLE